MFDVVGAESCLVLSLKVTIDLTRQSSDRSHNDQHGHMTRLISLTELAQ